MTLAVIALTGCQTAGPLKTNGMPAQKYAVGGGLKIDFRSPYPGVAYLVEAKSQKVLQTQSLGDGEEFKAEIDTEDEDLEKVIGMKPAKAAFRLYLVPLQDIMPAPKPTADKGK